MITADQYYNDINKIVCGFAERNKLHLIDIFLVGSRASNNGTIENKNADYDSIIIIKDNLSIDSLKNIRDNLQEEITQADKFDLYHFKLFSIDEFEKAKQYDGFRIYEFQFSYKSHFKTIYFSNNSISFDQFNFINSLLIQEVYGALANENNLNKKIENNKVSNRFKRNIKILQSQKINPYCTNDFDTFCKTNDTLYRQFTELKKEKSDWIVFLLKYFERFRHEFINKGEIYLNTINRFS